MSKYINNEQINAALEAEKRRDIERMLERSSKRIGKGAVTNTTAIEKEFIDEKSVFKDDWLVTKKNKPYFIAIAMLILIYIIIHISAIIISGQSEKNKTDPQTQSTVLKNK